MDQIKIKDQRLFTLHNEITVMVVVQNRGEENSWGQKTAHYFN